MIGRGRTTAPADVPMEERGERGRPGGVALDLVLIFLAGLVILAGVIAFDQPRLRAYPPPPQSDRVRAYVVGGLALAAGVGILAFVVLRGERRGPRSLRRLAGVLAVGATFPALIGAFNAAYFGANAGVLAGLAMSVGLVGAGAALLRRS